MAFYIFWAEPAALTQRGFGLVAHVPFVFDENWKYHRESSNYLVERATCTWPDGDSLFVKRFPTKKSLKSYAESLTNFLEWADLRGIDWRLASYTEHLYGGYQKEMLSGRWSKAGDPLASATINRRVNEACCFLSWAAARGQRKEFEVLTETIYRCDDFAISSHGHRPKEISSRIGKVRKNPKHLRLPTDMEIGKWLRFVQIQRGHTKELMCKLILDTGIRREEAACWRVDTLPEDVEKWEVLGDQVKVSIKFGCKGQSYGDDSGDKIGPERNIWMSLSMAKRLHQYRRGPRLKSNALRVAEAKSQSEQRALIAHPPPHMFLSEHNGRRISGDSLYEAWTGISYLPFSGWSPHAGRHWWACKVLLREYQKRKAQLGPLNVARVPLDWISGNTISDIQLLIRPQLGHIDKTTTELYVQWVVKILETESIQFAYQDFLDEIEAKAACINIEVLHGRA